MLTLLSEVSTACDETRSIACGTRQFFYKLNADSAASDISGLYLVIYFTIIAWFISNVRGTQQSAIDNRLCFDQLL